MISRNGADADTRKGSENRKKSPTSDPFFQKLKLQHAMKEPRPEDFLTEDDYEEAVAAYEAAVYEAEERAIEEYYENKNKSKR
jgi:hypothetical protein